jgi:hypothetical protein
VARDINVFDDRLVTHEASDDLMMTSHPLLFARRAELLISWSDD